MKVARVLMLLLLAGSGLLPGAFGSQARRLRATLQALQGDQQPGRAASHYVPGDVLIDVPALNATAGSIMEFVLWMIQEAGMSDQHQIMSVLHAEGFSDEMLETIFQGHEQENDAIAAAYQNATGGSSLVDDAMGCGGRRLDSFQDEQSLLDDPHFMTMPPPEQQQPVLPPGVAEQQMEDLIAASTPPPTDIQTEAENYKPAFAPGELEDALEELRHENDRRFLKAAREEIRKKRRKLNTEEENEFEDDPNLDPENCFNLIEADGTLAEKAFASYLFFVTQVDAAGYASLINRADTIGEKRRIADGINELEASQYMRCISQGLNTTITVEYSFDATILFFNMDFGLNIIFGEGRQFAVAFTKGFGFDMGLIGGGVAAGFNLRTQEMGGFDVVSASFKDVPLCLTIGYTPFIVGGAITMSILPTVVVDNNVSALVGGISEIVDEAGVIDQGELLSRIMESVHISAKIVSIGIESTIGLDLLDLVGAKLVTPDFTFLVCNEELLVCHGEGCEDKVMVPSYADGTLCLLGTSCKKCENKATYWYAKAWTACGKDDPWVDGTVCLLGTSCNQCKNKATYWWSKAFTACGSETPWRDGTLCLLGTSCNACANRATWWVGRVGMHCGSEPCWKRNTICGLGTTCHKCCRGHQAHCPWYWFGVCKCKFSS